MKFKENDSLWLIQDSKIIQVSFIRYINDFRAQVRESIHRVVEVLLKDLYSNSEILVCRYCGEPNVVREKLVNINTNIPEGDFTRNAAWCNTCKKPIGTNFEIIPYSLYKEENHYIYCMNCMWRGEKLLIIGEDESEALVCPRCKTNDKLK